jgi:hypothetical protein
MTPGRYLGAAGECEDPESKLLRLLEIQRRMQAADGNYYVGGLATLTIATADGISQRVVHRWPEDQPGQKIAPCPIDWTVWMVEREGVDVAGLSRLKQERMLKRETRAT